MVKICYKNRNLFTRCIKGMTLVELMVSLVILMLVLGAVYSILSIQQTKATQVSKTTVLQTDAQVAFTLLKLDLLHTGLGFPFDSVAYIVNGGVIGLRATGLGFESNASKWSYILTTEDPYILVRRWDDTSANFAQGETITVVDESRNPLMWLEDLVIVNNPKAETTKYLDTTAGGQDTIPASKILINGPMPTHGLMVFKRNKNIYFGGIAYRVSATGDSLYRGGELLLTNVEAIQFRRGVDEDGDGLISGNEWTNLTQENENPRYMKKNAIRFTMVVTSEGMPGYTYPSNTITIEENPPYTYTLNDIQRRKRRAILRGIVYPPNIQPPE
ncbi:MAG: prepilin-type N-terminal cleavage/methylation domain-containing protein [candidate division WOR-3 bacterium]